MAGNARRIVIEFMGKDTSAGKTAEELEKKYGKFGAKMQKVGSVAGKVLATGLLAGGAAMVKFGNQASDLAETQSKVNQIFGKEGAAALDKFAAGAAKSMGQSKQTALDAAATFGISGKAAGLAGKDLVDFSTKMTGLAGDMASFSNTSPEEAIEAIGSAMRGEAEPIRKYGVLLDDATLRNEALKMGLIKTTKEALTPQQKALAAQSAILKQTKDQQGDFARTSDGLANKQRILKAQFENVTTQLGQKALPVMLKVTDIGLKMLKWTTKHSTATKIMAGIVAGLVGTLYLVAKAQAAVNIAMAINPIGAVILALVALGAVLVLAYKKSTVFRETVKGALEAVGKMAKWLWNNAFQPALKMIVTGFGWVLTGIGKMLSALGRIPGFGWAAEAGRKMEAAGRDARKMADGIRDIPNKKEVKVSMPGSGKAISSLATIRQLMRDISSAGPVRPTKKGGFNVLLNPNGYAQGTSSARRGVALVGEHGAELVQFRGGERVTPNHRMPRGSAKSGDTYIINVHGALDPNAVGAQLEALLVKRQRTTGRPLQFATAT